MNEEYLVNLYSWIDSQDSTFKEDVDIESFKQKMLNEDYVKSIYEWIGSKDQTFTEDISPDMFSEKVGLKKKDDSNLGMDNMDSDSEDTSLESPDLEPQKILVDQLDAYNKKHDELTSDFRKYKKEIFDTNIQLLKEEKEAGARTPELLAKRQELEKRIDTLNQKELNLNEFKVTLAKQKAKTQKEAAEYIDKKAGGGSFIGAMYNSLLSGFETGGAGSGGIATDLATLFLPNFGMSDDDYNKMKKDGMSDTQILDKARKSTRADLLPAVRSGLSFAKDDSTTEAYMAKRSEESVVFEGMTGMAASLPAMLAPKAQRIIGFALMGMEAIDKETENNPDFADITESEKYIVKTPIAIVSAILENIGLRNIVSGNSSLLNYITRQVLGKTTKTTTAKTFTELVNKEVKNAVVKFGLRVGAAGAAEFETGAAQYAFEVGVKELYDVAKGKDLFKNPETIGEFIGKTIRSGVAEAIGGFTMGSVTSSVQSYRENQSAKAIGKNFDIINKFVEDDQLYSAYNTHLASELREGNITQEQYDQQIESLNEIKNISSKIPKNISTENRRKAYDLIREKAQVTKEMEGMDDALATPNKERLQEINNELIDIAKQKEQVDSESRYEIDGEQLSKEDFNKKIQESSSDQLSGMSIKVDNDQDAMNMVNQKMKPKETVVDLLNRPVILNSLAGSELVTPIQGDLYVEGQQVVIEDENGNITELGISKEEAATAKLSDLGIQEQVASVTATEDGNLLFNGETLVTETSKIRRNKRGEISSVTLRNEDGSVTRTLRGAEAEEAAYQILLKKATSPEQAQFINEQLEQNDEFREATAAPQAETDTDIEQTPKGNRFRSEPLQDATEISNRITGRERRDTEGPRQFERLDPEKSKKIADAYDKLENNPNDPVVKRSYEALVKETLDQYQAMLDAGYSIEIDNEEPYANSSEMIDDLRENKRIKIFSTESGFGDQGITDKQRKENPLLASTKFKDVNGEPLLANDVFRAVHDFFGHAQEGNSFGPRGEEIAWQVHSEMYSKDARRALTTETRGQNSWVNFSGVNEKAFKLRDEARELRRRADGIKNPKKKERMLRKAKALVDQAYASMSFADQKIGLLSDEFVFEEVRPITSEQVAEAGEKNLKEKFKPTSYLSKEGRTVLRERIFDRQARVKNMLKSVKSKLSAKAANLLVVKAGAKGYAKARFEEAEKKIFSGLNSKERKELDNFIYSRRIIAIVESKGRYESYGGFSINEARRDMAKWKNEYGDKKYTDFNKRADAYFDEYKKSLARLREAGLVTEKRYKEISAIDYSPIKTIDYLITETNDIDEISRMANMNGITGDQIKALTQQNEKPIITDSKWLLETNIGSVESKIFENRMLLAFDDAIKNATKEELVLIRESIVDNNDRSKDMDKGYEKVKFFRDGKEQFLVMKKTFADKLLDVKKQSDLDKIAPYTGTQVLRFMATGGNPLFIVGNTAVDFTNILLLSDTYSSFKALGGLELAYDFTRNFLKTKLSKDSYQKIYMDFMEHGGGMDYLSSDGLRALESLKPMSAIKKDAQKALLWYGRKLSALGEMSEISFRLAVYEKEISNLTKKFKKENNGANPIGQDLEDLKFEAARISRETIDFSQGGSSVKTLDKFLPYLNAATQGFRKGSDYAQKNPLGFASSMIQYGVMATSMATFSLALLMKRLKDDDEEDKVSDILNSVSVYEKSNYHIFFTGKKDEKGEYEYYRIKKLPFVAVLSTSMEQLVYKQMLKSKGINYEMDEKAISTSFASSLPIAIDISGSVPDAAMSLLSRNPAFSSLIALAANYDTFTKEQIFREPKGKKIKESAKGALDERVDQVYKDAGKVLNLSPKKLKVAIEKIVTSPGTNPMVGIFHSAYEGIFSSESNKKVFEEIQKAGEDLIGNSVKKLKRSTNKNILKYSKEDQQEKIIMEYDTELYNKERDMYNKINEIYDSGEEMDSKQLEEMVRERFDDMSFQTYYNKYMKFAQNRDTDRQILDIMYEQNPERQAMLLTLKYGESLDEEEMKDLEKAAMYSGRRLGRKTMYYYKQKNPLKK